MAVFDKTEPRVLKQGFYFSQFFFRSELFKHLRAKMADKMEVGGLRIHSTIQVKLTLKYVLRK